MCKTGVCRYCDTAGSMEVNCRNCGAPLVETTGYPYAEGEGEWVTVDCMMGSGFLRPELITITARS